MIIIKKRVTGKPIEWEEDEKGCWICTSHINNTNRYTRIWVNNKQVALHRFMYEYYKRKIPEKMEVCHSCDNTRCINPEHLFLGTHKENMQDCIKKKRFKMEMDNTGSRNGMSKLTEEQVVQIFYAKGINKEIGYKFNVTASCVSNIKSKRSWKHITKYLKL